MGLTAGRNKNSSGMLDLCFYQEIINLKQNKPWIPNQSDLKRSSRILALANIDSLMLLQQLLKKKKKVNTALNSNYTEAKTLIDFSQEQNLAQIHETFQREPGLTTRISRDKSIWVRALPDNLAGCQICSVMTCQFDSFCAWAWSLSLGLNSSVL